MKKIPVLRTKKGLAVRVGKKDFFHYIKKTFHVIKKLSWVCSVADIHILRSKKTLSNKSKLRFPQIFPHLGEKKTIESVNLAFY